MPDAVESGMPVLLGKQLRFRYPGAASLLDGVDLELFVGDLLHLRGRNGCGKTTFLRVLSGGLGPDEGEVLVDGDPLDPDVPWRRGRLARVPENLVPSPWLSVAEYLEFDGRLRDLGSEGLRERVDRTLSEWQLEKFRLRPVGSLSRGETRRVVLAAAFSSGARVLLLDEPSTGLDDLGRELFQERLVVATEAGAVLLTSHVDGPSFPGATRVVELVEGRLIEGERA